MKNFIFLFGLFFCSSAFGGDYKIGHEPLGGVYFGGEYTRSVALGYAAIFKDSDKSGPFHNGLYADAEFAEKGRSFSLGWARTSDVGIARFGISALNTKTEGLGDQKYIGGTLTMSIAGLSFRIGHYRLNNANSSVRNDFNSVSVGLGI
ncbi:MAG: hypothetical protein Q7U91_01440 [Sideroxyarcus sp.]|nr:hypothetical protein [Sideroxyarcus sp.]